MFFKKRDEKIMRDEIVKFLRSDEFTDRFNRYLENSIAKDECRDHVTPVTIGALIKKTVDQCAGEAVREISNNYHSQFSDFFDVSNTHLTKALIEEINKFQLNNK